MKRIIVNISFSVSFLLIFAVIILTYSDHFVQALTSNGAALFPKDKDFNIAKLQQWSEDVRDFEITKGEEASQVTVLMYHRIVDDEDITNVHYDQVNKIHDTIVLKTQFEKQMQLLKDHDYVTLTTKEFQLFMQGELQLPKKSILITFDDGFKDNYKEAYPILKKHNFTAVNYLITASIEEKTSMYDPKTAQYFSLEELKKSSDVFEFQSHTYNLHRKTENDRAYLLVKTTEDVKQDIAYSLNNLDRRNRSFAYPYGEYKQETIEILKQLGFEMAFTVKYADAKPGMNLFEIPRKGIYPEMTIEEFKKLINLDE